MRYEEGASGICPHCGVHAVFTHTDGPGGSGYRRAVKAKSPTALSLSRYVKKYRDGIDCNVDILTCNCSACDRIIISLDCVDAEPTVLWPKQSNRGLSTEHIPSHLIKDYQDAVACLNVSSNASAIMSRRCLEHMLRDKGAKGKNLQQKIQSIEDQLPEEANKYIDAIRKIGNIAAHPTNDMTEDGVIEVSTTEAAWMIDLIEVIFKHFYVLPSQREAKYLAIEQRLSIGNEKPS